MTADAAERAQATRHAVKVERGHALMEQWATEDRASAALWVADRQPEPAETLRYWR